jgi:tetratricopeptide (TPR) repeat protein
MKSRRAVPLIVVALSDEKSIPVRSSEIKALGEIGDPRAFKVLVRLVEHPEKAIRSNAVYALGVLGDERALGGLVAALMDSETEVREKSVEALRALRDQRAVYFVGEVLRLDASAEVRVLAASALFYLVGDDAVPFLINALEDESMYVRSTALRHLKTLTKESFGFVPAKDVDAQEEALKKWSRYEKQNEKRWKTFPRPALTEEPVGDDASSEVAYTLFERGRLAREKGDYRIATIYLKKAVRYSGDPSAAYLELARAHQAARESGDALDALERSIICDGRQAEAFHEMCALLMSDEGLSFGGRDLAEAYGAFGVKKYPRDQKLREILADIQKEGNENGR